MGQCSSANNLGRCTECVFNCKNDKNCEKKCVNAEHFTIDNNKIIFIILIIIALWFIFYRNKKN